MELAWWSRELRKESLACMRVRDDAALRRLLAAVAPVTAPAVVGDALEARARGFLFAPSAGSECGEAERFVRMGRLAVGG